MKIRSSHNPFHPRTLPLTTAPRTERAPAEQTSLSPEVRQQATDSVHLSSLVDGLESNYGGEEAESENAREVYARHGAQPHDLNDRRAVGQLISRAPQLDDLDGRRGQHYDLRQRYLWRHDGPAGILHSRGNTRLSSGNPYCSRTRSEDHIHRV